MIILDAGAALALAHGHEALHRLADNVAHTPGDWLHLPALCLMKAEESEANDAGALMALPETLKMENMDMGCSSQWVWITGR